VNFGIQMTGANVGRGDISRGVNSRDASDRRTNSSGLDL
jgi:hypothetical protein